jgi:undecaprenyl-diphosphatase
MARIRLSAARRMAAGSGGGDAVRAWLARLELGVLVAVFAAAAALFAFAEIADAVVEGDTRALDEFLLLSLRSAGNPSDPIGPRWLEETVRDFTALGGTAVLAALALAVVGFLFLTGKRQAAATVAVAVAGGFLLSNALKWGFARPRPDLVPHGQAVYTQSFPSSHAMLSAVVYLTLGALLARTQPLRRAKLYFLGVAALLTVVVGASRVYLGVHWPTDVLAGWTAGAAWALLCWLAMLWLQRRGRVEADDAPHPEEEEEEAERP